MKPFQLLLLCLFTVAFTGCTFGDRGVPEGADIRVGDPLPQFSVTLNDGREVSTQSLAGKVSLIVFVQVTCPDCQAQLPVVEDIYQTYKDNPDVVIFAVSREEGETEVADYWSGIHPRDPEDPSLGTYTLTMPYSAQESRYVYSLFARSLIPRIYLSDREGIVQYMTTDNPKSTYNGLKAEIDGLLQE